MAVEDIASAPPTTTATAGSTPSAHAAARRAGGEQHLQAADAEHLGLHRDHARQRELEAQREDQEHDADLGHDLYRGRVRGEPERVRAEEHADDEVAEDGRQVEAAHEAQHQHRAGEQDQDLGEDGAAHRSSRSRDPMLAFPPMAEIREETE